jgi:hypothetical protein
MPRTSTIGLVLGLALIGLVAPAAQERFSFFQASTPESVERMLTLAGLRDDDVVVDLGSGNGLIPLTAARMNAKLRGWGVDIDGTLVEESNRIAREEGLDGRVRFYHRNAFDADLSDATVVTMWLFPELMYLLRPVILERARPGTRVLTSTWDLGSWPPDEVGAGEPTIYKWIVPARVAGGWDWQLDINGTRVRYSSVMEQRFQTVEGDVRVGNRRDVLQSVTLKGEDLTFTVRITLDGLGPTDHDFTGKVTGSEIRGMAQLTPEKRTAMTLPWRAERAGRSDYFAPTGTEIDRQPSSGP